MILKIVISGLLLVTLAACSDNEQSSKQKISQLEQVLEEPEYLRWYKFQQVAEGGKIFKENCAACHGADAQGANNWRQRDANDMFPAPPLNGSGHGWHHPLPILFSVIKNGSPGGQGNMPAWKEKLSDAQILSAIAWFQSKWPEEIYQAWAQRDAAARKNKS